ncbi:2-amino-4-hydroxy-6-hydroxymethyldihydropteridine diphosphokinase [Sandaracinobacter neustonicus]|uniref:2-amino-4-hydroxy-6-hydroxymethyldihydropteridine pyrophosphokinase n=2 Tax=Sandaracinobacter neustonicus TaxID=1715348 RepID=A0A501XMG8_9SPHN|nr:2-amino-4-hydroxy-6-hydroxymethyldihydropteridine diphosphokinase [Sandaracinobacter neustonicus]
MARQTPAPRSATGPVLIGPVLIGLGGNRCHGRHGPPRRVIAAALAALEADGVKLLSVSRIVETPPLGPSNRRFANAAAEIHWAGTPEALLTLLQSIERQFGRKRWRRWGARVLDLDLLAFGQLQLAKKRLKLPHPALPERLFVLHPLAEIAPNWRHPQLRLTVRQMTARLQKPRPFI